jgi:peptidyl-tRNA hydrolase, PTH1 family
VTENDGTQVSQASPVPRLIIGLGNPGDTYRDTRHNIGFMVIDELAHRLGLSFTTEKRWDCLLAKFAGGWLMKPLTFMNGSGDAIRAVSHFYKLTPAETLVVFDDVDLPLGRVKMKLRGSAAGHNGLKSIISRLGTDEFPRLKVGIASEDGTRPAGDRMVGHVLGKFRAEEKPAVDAVIKRAADAATAAMKSGLAAAMNLFNRKEES